MNFSFLRQPVQRFNQILGESALGAKLLAFFMVPHRGIMVWIGVGASVTALASLSQGRIVESLDARVQSLFFQLRGPVAAPPEVVILAIDDASMGQGEFYSADPEYYSAMAPIQSWPWQRAAYGIAIDRLFQGGARAVALDIFFSQPSSYGPEDDAQLIAALERHPDRVVLAAQYIQEEQSQGFTDQLRVPFDELRQTGIHLGAINFTYAPTGQILEPGDLFLDLLFNPALNPYPSTLEQLPTFAAAALQAAQIPPAEAQPGAKLFFYGPDQTFEHIPFWKILDPEAWVSELDQGRVFENKIVLIGGTAPRLQDFHPTPFGESFRYPYPIAGVEIQANAIATAAQDRFLYPLIANRGLEALAVLALVTALSSGLAALPHVRGRLLLTLGNGVLWVVLGYGLQTVGHWLIPVAVPLLGLLTLGSGGAVLAIVRDYYRHNRLETAIRENENLPSVEELLNFVKPTAAELQAQTNLLSGRVLGQRYEVVQVLGMGGFSETFTAKDLQRPGAPICVVKQLKTHNQDPQVVHLVRRSFGIEAEMLERLGSHSQIPRLLAYFEEDEEFFLIQEYIEGISLLSEFVTQRYFTPGSVVALLADLLPVLSFVHHQKVIHRDIKPSNIIRSAHNGRLYLIDFGIAKAMTVQLLAAQQDNPITVGLGTQGYMPREQAAGHPVFSSDLYAVGVMAIQALTGLNPQQLGRDRTGELDWRDPSLGLSPELEQWITTMVQQDYNKRYASAQVALTALAEVPEFQTVAEEVRSAVAREGLVEYSMANLLTPNEVVSWDPDKTVQEDETFQTQPWPQDWQTTSPEAADIPTNLDTPGADPLQTRPWPQDWQGATPESLNHNTAGEIQTQPWPQDWQGAAAPTPSVQAGSAAMAGSEGTIAAPPQANPVQANPRQANPRQANPVQADPVQTQPLDQTQPWSWEDTEGP